MLHLTRVLPFGWDRSVGIVTRLRARRPKYRCSIPGRRKRIFFFPKMSRSALGHTHHPIQWKQGAISSGLKWPGRIGPTPPTKAKVWEYVQLYFHFATRLHCVVLNCAGNNFTLFLLKFDTNNFWSNLILVCAAKNISSSPDTA